ncbi:MAG: CoA transferase [Burkholderiales bacterium]|nr:CoA transferase [Burkholderiales bacterium]MDE1928126.1 CoA transferase [Burkholderiales bacterium]MDE2159538.1 CoA transferase [Burkholderiales bacterium]MDE2503458.1 CoA transferase [Burkholderiales bacterium]
MGRNAYLRVRRGTGCRRGVTLSQNLPLRGIRVIDYSHFLAGPHISRSLAALGADVIKVERPRQGDAGRASPTLVGGQSGYFMQQNMGKRGLCIDLKDARGLQLMHELTDGADVFVENYRPGALDKLGLGYAELARRNPRLVYCSVSAYGHTGPDAQRAGFGLIAEAKSGAMSLIGVPGERPPLFRMPIADMYAGMHGVAAVCAALYGRVASGRGQHIDIALYDCMVSMHDFAAQSWLLSGGREMPVQTGYDLPQSTVYGVFAARDGYLVIAAQADDAWKRFARLIGGEACAADRRFHDAAGRNAHRDEILARVREWTMTQASVAACCAALDAAGVPAAKVQDIAEVLTDPQTLARGMVVEQDHPLLGRIKLPNLPFRFSDCDTAPGGPAPLLGQHNREIAAALGYTAAQIDTLVADGVLYAEADVARLPGS